MKILFVLPNVAVGGVERVRMALIEEFGREGIECRLAVRRAHGELIDRARSLTHVHELAPRGIHQFVPELAKFLEEEKPSHVITAFPDVALLTWVAMRMARSRAKWIHSVDRTHSRVGNRPGALGYVRSWLEKRMAGFVYRHANAVVAVSDGLRREVVDQFRIDSARVTRIWNPVVPDAELLPNARTRRNAGSTPLSIVSLGRLVRLKGFDVLIRAMTMVRGDWTLDIWGVGPEYSRLGTVISGCGLNDRVRLRGYTSDPYTIMRNADLFVLPSWHEGLGNTVIEALACGCQIVATSCPYGPSEVLEGGRLGQLVPVGDPGALASAINRVLEDNYYVAPELLLARARDFSFAASCAQWGSLLRSV